MNPKISLIIFPLLISFFSASLFAQPYLATPVPFNRIMINDDFWSPRLENHSRVTLPVCIEQTQDSTQRIRNFEKAASLIKGEHEGKLYDDSDVYKAMEGIAYSLINNPNPEYEALLEKWIALIAKSQEEDGYLNTYFTLSHPKLKWTDMSWHEMYCGGHMIEAAIAHFKATGHTSFLDVATRFADHLDHSFGPGKQHWVPGHQEIELALVKLYRTTNERKYLDLAHWLLEERGHGHGVSKNYEKPNRGPAYCQDDVPVSEITDIKGHAVRAMYLFTGMADVAAEKKLTDYIEALNNVWEDVVCRNMYITGGIGSSKTNEGFTEDYDLPNKTAYCETCASIGMVLWNNRMNLLTQDAKYADILERSLYNGVMAGISLKGDRFFYVNPLESEGDHHRQRWFGTACCPSNLSRIIPSVGDYIYFTGENEIFINLYIGNEAIITLNEIEIKLIQHTAYPWDGKIQLEVSPSFPVDFCLKMRIPDWCKNFSVSRNNKKVSDAIVNKGYISIPGIWNRSDKVELILEMPVELVSSDPRVMENIGKRAIQKGPLVYCLEEVDNKKIDFDSVFLSPDNSFKTRKGKDILNGMTILQTIATTGQKLVFVPYFAWDNREPGKMKVWVDYR